MMDSRWIFSCLMVLAAAFEVVVADEPPELLHPPVVLLDAQGEKVVDTLRPISTTRTCGACHDTSYIAAHSYHVWLGRDECAKAGTTPSGRPWDFSPGLFGRWNPIFYRYLTPPGDARLDLGTAEWIQVMGRRHVGGGPAEIGYGNQPLKRARPGLSESNAADPDRQILDAVTRQAKRWDWTKSGTVEMNCFLCHVHDPDNTARIETLANGDFQWANTATLAKTGLVRRRTDLWSYDRDLFRNDGSVAADLLQLGPPAARHCGQCHGQTHEGDTPLKLDLSLKAWSTATKGQVFSSQRIFQSAVNLYQKQQLTRPWDVHAERLLDCKACHFSLNNPAAYEPSRSERPQHLVHEPRRLTPAEFLRRPSHQFAKGQTAQGTVARPLDGTMRRCDDCHDAVSTHDWLPYRDVHFAELSCEACHVERAFAPAIQQVDWTLLTPQGEPLVQWRGIDGHVDDPVAEVTGFQPVLLMRHELGAQRLTPYNLISTWYWVEATTNGLRPVRQADLRAALLEGNNYHPEVRRALDTDHDGMVDPREQRLDDEAKVAAVRQRLEAVGVANPHIEAEIQPYGLHHGVGPADTSIRQCETCHSSTSRLGRSMVVASYLPGGVEPKLIGDCNLPPAGTLSLRHDGALVFSPNLRDVDLYVLGFHGWGWVYGVGLLAISAMLLAIAVHAGLRVRSALRHKSYGTAVLTGANSRAHGRRGNETKTARLELYTLYERFWHWVQAVGILLLIITGVWIHAPDRMGPLSFHTAVWIHNGLGFILVANAFLGMFYYMATGSIRHYMPDPNDFVTMSLRQLKYYSVGIFRGEPHPLEKSPARRLNPLQQVTYLVILNVLLPLQIITGVLMWSGQYWPESVAMLGGVAGLSTVHLLGAWLLGAFVVAHIYLTTTGRTLWSNIKAMIVGYENITDKELDGTATTSLPPPLSTTNRAEAAMEVDALG